MKRSQGPLVIIYDNGCAYCRRQVQRVQSLDKRGLFECVAMDDPTLVQRYPVLAYDTLRSRLRLLHPDGVVHVGADAVYEIARRLPGWRWLAWLYRLPGLHTFFRWLYLRVSLNRWQAGETECASPCHEAERDNAQS